MKINYLFFIKISRFMVSLVYNAVLTTEVFYQLK